MYIKTEMMSDSACHQQKLFVCYSLRTLQTALYDSKMEAIYSLYTSCL